ncbi:hypothetical protein [Tautonia plasticadhaerens]|uniref:Uncharacterized protein n=1 Tax=Tautonia plasticadhaerens TaxID=2527974 RepID=A0A518H4C5_9BACT|nr:hypothetical protein [Tautonia plasticadhaerens]QDV35668.1 hypothetical protein ElP_35720 [Tautonia plasticadhaerens]
MPRGRPRFTLADILLIVILSGLSLGFLRWLGRSGQGEGILLPILLFELAFLAWFLAWRTVRGRRRARPCEECGRPFVPGRGKATSTRCPQCRTRSLFPQQVRREQARALRAIPGVLLLLMVVLGFLLSEPVETHFGDHSWVALPLVALGAVVVFFGVTIAVALVIALVRNRLLGCEGYAFAMARRSCGKPGEVSRSGPLVAWSSDPPTPLPMLGEQLEVARRRFESLLGEPVEVRLPIRILCFGRRSAFVAYHKNMIPNLWNLDGLYLNRPIRTITRTTEASPCRLSEPERTARTLFGFALLDELKGFIPPPWLQQGLGNLLAGGGDRGELDRLSRKMVVALARGTALGPDDLFDRSPRKVVTLAKGWYDHPTYVRFAQFNAQSWSVVEYLGGVAAPEDRRARFRAFLKDMGPKDDQEQVFERHFGHGFGPLLDGWRAWVEGRGIGEYGPTPPDIRDALLERLIPTITDRDAKVMDRILAVRDMGRAGYVFGAAALIALLGDGDEVLKPEAIWSLEAISGLPWGDDADRWAAWWQGFPEEVLVPDDPPEPRGGPLIGGSA